MTAPAPVMPHHKVNGFIKYGTSPHHLKPFAGALNPGVPKFVRLALRQAAWYGPPLLFFYGLKSWADSKFEYYSRKEYLLSPEGRAATA